MTTTTTTTVEGRNITMQDLERDYDDDDNGTWRKRAASAVLVLMGLASAPRPDREASRPFVRTHRRNSSSPLFFGPIDDDKDVREWRKKKARRALRDCGLD
ncbi:hypothetical protein pdul_cds_200 [Pandoravirus dulcis]|uniref:Uncharacterized protein n=1 Tax=Pandoravirus dulcis TaxID=1349409 RepID=S4VW23_9VIRU|nr:hypothetical protein pdul_cds_200 [Pandoravirus dulcis]AGO82139.2 hypothetical protein pdul_cds_200 [Pandoravirus dulcis]